MIRVAVVDDQYLVRTGLRALLERSEDITVIGEADSGTSGVTLALLERPDVMLMDLRMPGMDGVEATRRIVADERTAGVRVLVLTTFDTDADILAAIRAGASGFLLKDTDPEALRDAVRTVAGGDALLSPSITRRVMNVAARQFLPADAAMLDTLSEREREVLIEVAAGRSNDEISTTLFISPGTARTYVSRLMSKLAARSRSQLVVIAYETGLVAPGGGL